MPIYIGPTEDEVQALLKRGQYKRKYFFVIIA